MKHLLRATAEKTKPICKNEKMNLFPCLKMSYEEKYSLRQPEKQTQFKLEAQRRPLRVSFLETANQGPIYELGPLPSACPSFVAKRRSPHAFGGDPIFVWRARRISLQGNSLCSFFIKVSSVLQTFTPFFSKVTNSCKELQRVSALFNSHRINRISFCRRHL